MTTHGTIVRSLVTLTCIALPSFAQQSKVVTSGPIIIRELKHDTGPALREIAPLLPEYSLSAGREIENQVNPNHNWSSKYRPDPVLQTAQNSPAVQTPTFSLEFEGLGFSDQFFCNCAPPDNDGAPGVNQYVQYINTSYAVYDKRGNRVLGPLNGNAFWSGFGGPCETENDGDPIVRFDAMAQRWMVSQVDAFNGYYECVAVSQTSDATGAYYRYAFPFNNESDYPKVGVWPDAYYMTFNMYDSQLNPLGANACAADRNAMLAGNAAQMICFQQDVSQFGELPADLDGSTLPPPGTPNFVMELDPSGSANLDMFKFHVDFANPANSTFTGPTAIPVAAFTALCNAEFRGRCVTQPTQDSDLLESLGDRLMWRLVYRNFSDHSTLLVSHSIVAGSSGGVRWYEIHNPESNPTVYQSGTFAPDSQFRWMPAIAMDHNQNIAVGFSRSGSGTDQYPSLVYAGRVPGDQLGTLEGEVTLKPGLGSQIKHAYRWGDYTSLAIDPTDDCTFWFTEEYQRQTGFLDWSTAIGAFNFPGCGGSGGGPFVVLTPNTLLWGKRVVGKAGAAKPVILQNTGNATLHISGVSVEGDFALAVLKKTKKVTPCVSGSAVSPGASCEVKVTFTPTQKGTRNGFLNFTDDAPGSPHTVGLTGTGK